MKVTVKVVSGGRASSETNASHLFSVDLAANRRMRGSAATSSWLAMRTVNRLPWAVTCVCLSTLAGSMSWSKEAKKTGSRLTGPPVGQAYWRDGGGVRKVQLTGSASFVPSADGIPSGMKAENSVAMGILAEPSTPASNRRVLEPTQRQRPGTAGCSSTGMSPAASCWWLVRGTMGRLKVTLSWGARGTSPSGAKRRTARGAPACVSGGVCARGGGNGSSTSRPGRGGGRL